MLNNTERSDPWKLPLDLSFLLLTSYHMQASSLGEALKDSCSSGQCCSPWTPFNITTADGKQRSDLCNLNVCIYCALWAHSPPAQLCEEGSQRAAWLKCAWYFSQHTVEAFRLVEVVLRLADLVLRLEEMKVSVPLCWWPFCLLILMDIATYLIDFPEFLTCTSSLAWAVRWFARSSWKCSLYKTSPTCERTAFHSCPDQTSEQIPILLFIHSVVSSEKQNKAQPNQNTPVIKAKLSVL